MRPKNPLEVRDRDALKEYVDTSTRITKHSVRSLAEITGVSHATIGDLLTGRKKRVTLTLARKLSAALGASMEDLFMPVPSVLPDTDETEEDHPNE